MITRFLLLAAKNIFRNRRRTAMSLIVVSGGVAGLLLVGGFFNYMFFALQETTISNGLGHLQITTAAQPENPVGKVLDDGLQNYQALIQSAEAIPHIKGVVPRIGFFGMISDGGRSSVFMATAVDPVQERRLGFRTRLVEGEDLDAQSGARNEVLLGAGLAESLQAHPGTGLTLLTNNALGVLNGIDVVVRGIVKSGFKELDERSVRMPIESAQTLLGSNRVSTLVVGLDQTRNTDPVDRALTIKLHAIDPQLRVQRWIDLSPYYRQVRLLFSGIFLFLGIIVFFVVVMSTANTLMASMFERTREIGAMLAMGTPESWLICLFLVEALLIGLIGALGGVASGTLLGTILNHLSITLPPPPGNNVGLPLKVRFDALLILGASALVILTLVLASVIPAIRGARLRIVEALAHV